MIKRTSICCAVASCVLFATTVDADIWVFEPSITLDQRVDDNYFLEPSGNGSLSATRAVGELGLSRESEVAVIKGLIRVDGLLTTQSDAGEEGLESNQLIAFDTKIRSARSNYGVYVGFKQDTPSRNIVADLSDPNSAASDTGLNNPAQSSNVARQEITIKPSFNYNISRRLEFNSAATLKFVEHELPSAQETIYQRYYSQLDRDIDGNIIEPILAFNDVTFDDLLSEADPFGVFSPVGELDDFQDREIKLGLRYKFSPISTIFVSTGFSTFNAEVEVDGFAFLEDQDFSPDPDEPRIRRKPRRDSISTTTSVDFGVDHSLSPTLLISASAGVYTNTTDRSDTLRDDDINENNIGNIPAGYRESLKSDNAGWLASLSFAYDAGLTRYSGRFAVDVQPSSSGTHVETQELIGDYYRIISPRLNVSVRARAFEPDRLGAREEDRFARRFISFEPKVEWKYARNWTVSAAYRYRRQKARVDPISAESNAILLSLKYTPPSEIRDVANANGL